MLYYALRKFSEKNILSYEPIAGFSFDAITHLINIDGSYELDELDSLSRFLDLFPSSSGIALDIGANLGNHSIRLFSKRFERVICFEPNPKIFKLLSINTEDIHNIEIRNFGLSNKSECVNFKLNKTNWGSSSIVNPSDEIKPADFITIDVKSLDEVLTEVDSPISLIKIDVEGHEINVLNGALRTIRRDKPIIVFEENVETGSETEAIVLLKDLGYQFYVFKENFKISDSPSGKLLTKFLQDIFGKRITVERAFDFDKGYYPFILAIQDG